MMHEIRERGERAMNKTIIGAALAAGVMFGYSGRAWTQTDQKLPVAGYAPATGIPGAREAFVQGSKLALTSCSPTFWTVTPMLAVFP